MMQKKIKYLTLSAVMVAAAVVLSFLSKVIPAPWLQGGNITLASAVPILAVSLICGTRWGLLSSVVYGIFQMMIGFYPPPTQNAGSFFLVIFSDYLLAYGVYGTANVFYKRMQKSRTAVVVSGSIALLLRYACHILSGILIWGGYAAPGQSVLAYSIGYNGSYMIPETILTAVVLAVLTPLLLRLRRRFQGKAPG